LSNDWVIFYNDDSRSGKCAGSGHDRLPLQ
jgi:hypothetical protein